MLQIGCAWGGRGTPNPCARTKTYAKPSGGSGGVVARCGTVLIFLGIVPGEEAHRKPLWRVFPNACGWSPEAFG